MKRHWKLMVLTSLVIVLPILAGIFLWNQLPEQIPSHWNLAGAVDGWSSKPWAVFAMPLLLLALHWFAVFVTFADPKKKNHSEKILHLVFWLIPLLNAVLSAITYSTALGAAVQVELVVAVFMGLLFVIIGNYLPKCQQNYTVGIKIPWTLASEENWNKTHRLAGRIWVIGGLFIALMGFLKLFWIMLPIPLIMALAPIVYSYLLHRKGI